jgi:hypothetical protein
MLDTYRLATPWQIISPFLHISDCAHLDLTAGRRPAAESSIMNRVTYKRDRNGKELLLSEGTIRNRSPSSLRWCRGQG